MPALVNIAGRKFGKLRVGRRRSAGSGGRANWLCRCDCGKSVIVAGSHLRSGHSTSCGCARVGGPRRLKDVIGRRYGRLIVLRRYRSRWLCLCDCGRETAAIGTELRSGRKRSCGCLRVDAHLRHGGMRRGQGPDGRGKWSREYASWAGMIWRCTNPQGQRYEDYGGRGIKVCRRWLCGTTRKHPFECFLEDMGKRPVGKTIDRIENDGNYKPNNCRWASPAEQRRNQRPRRRQASGY